MLVLVRLGCGNSTLSASRLVRAAVGRGLRLRESEVPKIHAQTILGCGANPGFCVNCAAQMIVQISALGHAEEKVTKLKQILPRGLQPEFGALLRICRYDRRTEGLGLCPSRAGEEQQNSFLSFS